MMIADTDVLIDFLGGRAPAAERLALELERGQLRTTVITRFELMAGMTNRRRRSGGPWSGMGRASVWPTA